MDFKKNFKSLARAISLVENQSEGFESILQSLDSSIQVPVIGVTGPPGAGKSSLVNAMVETWAKENKKIAIVAVDPSSAFNLGALLGDRLRMGTLYTLPNVFIRSVASRGNLGGLCATIIEITELLKNYGFDTIIIETVGVGQSEIEVAGIADITVLVTVPESGDEVQTLKSGVMEIADIFVVNKCDRPGAETFAKFLQDLSHNKAVGKPIPVVQTSTTDTIGIDTLMDALETLMHAHKNSPLKYILLAEKIRALVAKYRMQDFDLDVVAEDIQKQMNLPGFNLYNYSRKYLT